MIIFKKAAPLTEMADKLREEGQSIAFVPTMGALHEGHIQLIKDALLSHDACICSIFVNPTQFTNEDDFIHYPKTIEADIEKLVAIGCSMLFLPDFTEVYPNGHIKKIYPLGYLEHILEGKYRPGHFQGVCEVVDKLLHIVKPNTLYLGQKDLQQCLVIHRLIDQDQSLQHIKIEIEPIVREGDGLAMSSRNRRLTVEQRSKALQIYQSLKYIKENINHYDFEELKNTAMNQLSEQGFITDYIEISNRNTLLPGSSNKEPLVVLAAATIGKVRLIDNLYLN